jgi:hypothetical protein
MDGEIMEMIDREVALLPRARSRKLTYRARLYIAGKTKLCTMFKGHEEYVCKAVARKYRV